MDRLRVGLELLALRGGAQLSVFRGLCRKGNRKAAFLAAAAGCAEMPCPGGLQSCSGWSQERLTPVTHRLLAPVCWRSTQRPFWHSAQCLCAWEVPALSRGALLLGCPGYKCVLGTAAPQGSCWSQDPAGVLKTVQIHQTGHLANRRRINDLITVFRSNIRLTLTFWLHFEGCLVPCPHAVEELTVGQVSPAVRAVAGHGRGL